MENEYILSLDIGGTNTRVAIVTPDYKIKKSIIHPTVTGSLSSFLKSVEDIIREITPNMENCKAISIGVPGRVRPDGYIEALPNIGIKNVPLGEYIKGVFNIPCYVKNDAEVAALAEACVGPYKNAKSLYFVTISTGVGAALIINGQLRNSSNENGHLMTKYHSKVEEFEHLASGTGIVNLCKSNNINIKSAKEFFDLIQNKDSSILPVYKDWISLLSHWFNNVNYYFHPEVFTLTGGVMKSADIFWEDLKAACPNLRLEKCYFSQEAGLIGSAVYGYQKITY